MFIYLLSVDLLEDEEWDWRWGLLGFLPFYPHFALNSVCIYWQFFIHLNFSEIFEIVKTGLYYTSCHLFTLAYLEVFLGWALTVALNRCSCKCSFLNFSGEIFCKTNFLVGYQIILGWLTNSPSSYVHIYLLSIGTKNWTMWIALFCAGVTSIIMNWEKYLLF